MDAAPSQTLFYRVLRGPCPVCGRVRGFNAERPGDVHHQSGESGGLRHDVLVCPSVGSLRGRWVWCGRLFTREVRHSDGAAPVRKTGGSERLDRRYDGGLDYFRDRAGWRTHRSQDLRLAAEL